MSVCNWHPTTHEIMASGSLDNRVHVWNITNGATIWENAFDSSVVSLDWNPIGSLIGCTTKEKTINVVDPRSKSESLKVQGHEGLKTQKMVFLNNNEYILSAGFSKTNERQLKLWDFRNFTKQ